jgi:hypothetical protein
MRIGPLPSSPKDFLFYLADARGTREVHAKAYGQNSLVFKKKGGRAVGIENTTRRNFKDLEGMLGNAKALKRNNGECKGILIGPLMAPRFSRPLRFLHSVFHSLSRSHSRLRAQIFAARMASRRNFTNRADPNS